MHVLKCKLKLVERVISGLTVRRYFVKFSFSRLKINFSPTCRACRLLNPKNPSSPPPCWWILLGSDLITRYSRTPLSDTPSNISNSLALTGRLGGLQAPYHGKQIRQVSSWISEWAAKHRSEHVRLCSNRKAGFHSGSPIGARCQR